MSNHAGNNFKFLWPSRKAELYGYLLHTSSIRISIINLKPRPSNFLCTYVVQAYKGTTNFRLHIFEVSAGLMFCNLLKEGRNFVVLSHSDPVLRKEGTYYLDRLPLNFEVLKFLNPLFTLPLLVTNAA